MNILEYYVYDGRKWLAADETSWTARFEDAAAFTAVAHARFADGQYFDNVALHNDTFGSFLAAAKAAEGVS